MTFICTTTKQSAIAMEQTQKPFFTVLDSRRRSILSCTIRCDQFTQNAFIIDFFASVFMPVSFFSACQTLSHQEAPEDTITSGCLPSRLDLAAENCVARYRHYFTGLLKHSVGLKTKEIFYWIWGLEVS